MTTLTTIKTESGSMYAVLEKDGTLYLNRFAHRDFEGLEGRGVEIGAWPGFWPPRVGESFTFISDTQVVRTSTVESVTTIDLEALRELLATGFSVDTSVDPGEWDPSNPAAGHCAIATHRLVDTLGGSYVSTRVDEESHWFWRYAGFDIDLTGDQFGYDAVRAAPEGELYVETQVRYAEDLNAHTLERAAVFATRTPALGTVMVCNKAERPASKMLRL